MGVSNTSGTYEAFFKNWESRSNKEFLFTPLSIEKRNVLSQKNKTYNQDANELVREIEGDIVIDDNIYGEQKINILLIDILKLLDSYLNVN